MMSPPAAATGAGDPTTVPQTRACCLPYVRWCVQVLGNPRGSEPDTLKCMGWEVQDVTALHRTAEHNATVSDTSLS